MDIGLGIDVGGSKILACAVEREGRVIGELRVDSPTTREGLLDTLFDIVARMDAVLMRSDQAIDTVGVGLPGLVDADGVLNETPNMSSAQGLDVRREFSPRLVRHFAQSRREPPTIVIDNDATCAAAGECAYGAARGESDAVVVTLGTGIGGGFVMGGSVMHGARGFAGEIGHMVIEPDGPPCACGGRGCWEQFASGTGLARLARSAVADGRARHLLDLAHDQIDLVRGEHVFAAAREGDVEAAEIVVAFSRYLAIGLSNLAEIFDPSSIILSGGLSEDSEVFLEATRSEFGRFRRGSGVRAVQINVAELGERAGAIGAAALALGVV